MSTLTHRTALAWTISALSISLLGASILAQTVRSAEDVTKVKLPLELLAIGNIETAKNWRFGRIESVVQQGPSDDVKIRIRIADGTVLDTVGPRVLSELARASNWVSAEASKDQLTRPDYVERMVAFDVDDNNRIVAMISMEPIDRDRRRLLRGLQ